MSYISFVPRNFYVQYFYVQLQSVFFLKPANFVSPALAALIWTTGKVMS